MPKIMCGGYELDVPMIYPVTYFSHLVAGECMIEVDLATHKMSIGSLGELMPDELADTIESQTKYRPNIDQCVFNNGIAGTTSDYHYRGRVEKTWWVSKIGRQTLGIRLTGPQEISDEVRRVVEGILLSIRAVE